MKRNFGLFQNTHNLHQLKTGKKTLRQNNNFKVENHKKNVIHLTLTHHYRYYPGLHHHFCHVKTCQRHQGFIYFFCKQKEKEYLVFLYKNKTFTSLSHFLIKIKIYLFFLDALWKIVWKIVLIIIFLLLWNEQKSILYIKKLMLKAEKGLLDFIHSVYSLSVLVGVKQSSRQTLSHRFHLNEIFIMIKCIIEDLRVEWVKAEMGVLGGC